MRMQQLPSDFNVVVVFLKAHKFLKFTGSKCLIKGQVAMSNLQKFSSTYFAQGTKYNLLEPVIKIHASMTSLITALLILQTWSNGFPVFNDCVSRLLF